MKEHTVHGADDSRGTMGQWEPAVQHLSNQIAEMRVTGSTQTAELKTYVDQQVTETGRRLQETLQRDIQAHADTLTTGVQKQLADSERALERKIGVQDPWTAFQGEIREIQQHADRQMQKLQTGVLIDLQGLGEQIAAVQEMEHAMKDEVREAVRQVTEYVDNQISAATTAQRRQREQDLKKIMTEVESQGSGIQEQAQQDMHRYVEQRVKEVHAGLAEELQDRSGRVHRIRQSGDVQKLQEALRQLRRRVRQMEDTPSISSLSTSEQESDSDGSGRRPRCDKVWAVPPKHLSSKDPPPRACRLFQDKARAVTAEHDDTTDEESRYEGRGRDRGRTVDHTRYRGYEKSRPSSRRHSHRTERGGHGHGDSDEWEHPGQRRYEGRSGRGGGRDPDDSEDSSSSDSSKDDRRRGRWDDGDTETDSGSSAHGHRRDGRKRGHHRRRNDRRRSEEPDLGGYGSSGGLAWEQQAWCYNKRGYFDPYKALKPPRTSLRRPIKPTGRPMAWAFNEVMPRRPAELSLQKASREHRRAFKRNWKQSMRDLMGCRAFASLEDKLQMPCVGLHELHKQSTHQDVQSQTPIIKIQNQRSADLAIRTVHA